MMNLRGLWLSCPLLWWIFSVGEGLYGQVPPTQVLIIYDASNSMYGYWGKSTKWEISKKILFNFLDSISRDDNVEIGLRVFGHTKSWKGPERDCQDTRLEVPIGKNTKDKIKEKIGGLKPMGTTPLAYSIKKGADDFRDCGDGLGKGVGFGMGGVGVSPTSPCRKIIVIVTDGIEECGGDVCEAGRYVASRGITIRPFIIGVGMSENDMASLKCLGNVIPAPEPQHMEEGMRIVISQTLNPTICRLFVTDRSGRNTEDSIMVSIIPHGFEYMRQDYFYYIMASGKPPELNLDPSLKYRVVVHTVPSVVRDSMSLIPGTNNVWNVVAPTGYLVVSSEGVSSDFASKVVVRIADTNGNTLAFASLNEKVRLLEGVYSVELNTIPPLKIDSVYVSVAHTTSVGVPPPGILTITSSVRGYGSIFYVKDGEWREAVKLSPDKWSYRYYLQPGEYVIVFHPEKSKNLEFAKRYKFKVESMRSVSIKVGE